MTETTTATTIEAGKTYRIQYGNGTQFFHVVRLTPRGKPIGMRLYGYKQGSERGGWEGSSLKINDPRVIREEAIPFDATQLPALMTAEEVDALETAYNRLEAAASQGREAFGEMKGSPWGTPNQKYTYRKWAEKRDAALADIETAAYRARLVWASARNRRAIES